MFSNSFLVLWCLAPAIAVPPVLLRDDQTNEGENAGCYNVTNMNGFDIERFMMNSEPWYEVERNKNSFESECGQVLYNFNGGGFQMYFNNNLTMYTGNQLRDGTVKVGYSGDGVYSHVVVSTDYTSYAVLYSCKEDTREQPLSEYVWILSRSKENQLDEEVMAGHERLRQLLDGGRECSDDQTESTTAGHAESTETESTVTVEITTDLPEQTSQSSTDLPEQTSTEPGSPQTTLAPETSTENQPELPQGFHIPNSNRTFYFLGQFQPETLDK